ncbi:UDP-N-acetylmuramate dehydrogenase [Thermophilibacter immobilis]|uniref:UDP-N-acetylenolpyruvoylglucosamine reductase n=1 Tax=Thermophilibacter immobilis TaxID=2779519 RepID=A0A7S7M7W4_9ACTN|nr:UDP-N-acetylmuramate dehydrogenase [Thermophilibacter immobilis]QOY60067.1 UDP-N-acetylmuramate dehydrogenase [Thermophilibacter immobilis]
MSVFNAYMSLSGAVDADVLRAESLARRTTYRIGGPAALLVVAHGYAALARTLAVLEQEGVAWVIVGKGSNLLVADRGYDGCVIVLDKEFARLAVGEDATITAGAGVVLSKVVNEALKASVAGLACCAGIPGTLGGAVSMNAGDRREGLGARVRDLVVLRPGKGLHRYAGSDVEWGQRSTSLPTSEIVLEATFALERTAQADIARDMESRLRRRRETQPLGAPSAGAVFRDPPERSVALLIESCGLGGLAVGGAQLSGENPNFILNRGGATAADVVAVMGRVHDSVWERCGVDLSCAVKLLGFGA